MATHSSVLAWRIPGTGEPGGLPQQGRYHSFKKERGHFMILMTFGKMRRPYLFIYFLVGELLNI